MSLIIGILRALACGSPAPTAPASPAGGQEKDPEGPSLSQWYTLGAHRYRRKGDVNSVVFTNRRRRITRMIVNSMGYICHFPGVDERAAACVNPSFLKPIIRFRTDFSRQEDGRIRMVWKVQPDGRCWEDKDGFGGTNDEEISLYTFIDENGRFTSPFRLYKTGSRYHDR